MRRIIVSGVTALALVVAGPSALAAGPTPSPDPAEAVEPDVVPSTPAPRTASTPTPTSTPAPSPSASPSPTPTPPKPQPKPKYVKKTVTIGTTVKGRKIRATYKGYEKAKHVVVVIGQMHGDELAGPKVVKRMVDTIRVGSGKGVWFIPTMNPDGAARGTRTNARGVDLNRNWPTSGFTSRGKGTRTWGGPKAQSERETRAVLRFIKDKKPDYIASIHQPYGVIAKTGRDPAWEKRLSKALFLPIRTVGVGTPSKKVSPTLTGYYNRFFRKHGTATTIELRSSVSGKYIRKHAAPGILRSAKAL